MCSVSYCDVQYDIRVKTVFRVSPLLALCSHPSCFLRSVVDIFIHHIIVLSSRIVICSLFLPVGILYLLTFSQPRSNCLTHMLFILKYGAQFEFYNLYLHYYF